MSSLWGCARRGGRGRRAAREIRPLQRYTRRLLREGERSSDRKARALCRALLRLWPALWTFARAEGRALGVPVTNNAAERALRPPVLWRKNCFFSQSERGLRFVERMLTVVTSCRQQGTSPLEFLTEAIVAHRLNTPLRASCQAAERLQYCHNASGVDERVVPPGAVIRFYPVHPV